jgi:hypothetical protein
VQHSGHDGVDRRYRRLACDRARPVPIVNGPTTDFTHPFAMIIHGNPAHERFPQIKVQRLRGNPAHVRVSQLWVANILN